LYLGENNISSLPPEIFELSKLQTLGLFHNKITFLPKDIEKLSNLQVLNLQGNQLTTLPSELVKLNALTRLELGRNRISSLPFSIDELVKNGVNVKIDGNPIEKQYDLFISHASEDKEFVRPLAEAFRAKNVRIWYDDFTLKLGDELRKSIESGLKNSRYGLVVLSHDFFAKKWPQDELNALLNLAKVGKKIIIPIWHNLTAEDIEQYAVMLVNYKATSSSDGVETIVEKVLEVLNNE